MKKIFSLVAAVLVAGSMLAETPKLTLDFTAAGWSFPTEAKTTTESYTNGGYTISVAAATGHKAMTGTGGVVTALLIGKKDATLTLPALSFNVSKIIVKGVSTASGKTTYNVFVGDTKMSASDVTSCKVDHEFTIPKASQTAGTVYVIKVTNDNNWQTSAIEFYEAVAGAPENPVFSPAGGVYDAAQTVTLSCETEGAEIYYTLDGTDPSASSTKYTAALNITETTTVKAIAIKNSINSEIITAKYKIVTLAGDGSEANPYTVADVIALEGSRPDAAWVVGYIVGALKSDGTAIDNAVNTNLALGATATAGVESVISVQLPSGNIRDALNVVNNASNIGKELKVKGTLELYLNHAGVKGVSEYKMDGTGSAIENIEAAPKTYKTIYNGQVVIIRDGVRYNTVGQVIE